MSSSRRTVKVRDSKMRPSSRATTMTESSANSSPALSASVRRSASKVRKPESRQSAV